MGLDEASKGIGAGIGIAAMGIGLGVAFDAMRNIIRQPKRKKQENFFGFKPPRFKI